MLYWNPDRFFTIPFLNIEMSWYFFFWGLGFLFSLFFGFLMLERFFWNYPGVFKADLKRDAKQDSWFLEKLNLEIDSQVDLLQESKYLDFEVRNKAQLLKRFTLEKAYEKEVFSLRIRSLKLVFELFAYIVVFAFLGSRIFHFIAYEEPGRYLKTPWILFEVWKGGRSAHGGIIGMFIAILIFCCRQKKNYSMFNWKCLADITTPSLFFGLMFTRFGNFFTQEILGKETSMPWGVVYGYPVDGSIPMPLHPVQLYEAIAYFAIVIFLLHLSRKLKFMLGEGKLFGLGSFLSSSARFFIEFFKQEQSHIMEPNTIFTMGQILSIPFIIFGFAVYYKSEIFLLLKEKRFSFKKQVED